jgi:hypothetical protein
MSDPVIYAHGSTAPPLDIDLVRGRTTRTAVELDADADVEATITRPGLDPITRNAVVTDLGAASVRPARVRVVWQADDLVNTTDDVVEYRVDLAITTDAGIERLPAPLTIRVRPAV